MRSNSLKRISTHREAIELFATFEAKVALVAIRGNATVPELASEHKVHLNLIMNGKGKAAEGMVDVILSKLPHETKMNELYAKTGELRIEEGCLSKVFSRRATAGGLRSSILSVPSLALPGKAPCFE